MVRRVKRNKLREGTISSTSNSNNSNSVEHIESATANNGEIEFTNIFSTEDGYPDYQLRFRNLKSNGDVILRFSDDGGSTYYNGTEYFWSRRRSGSGGGGSNDGPAGSQSEIKPVFTTDGDNDPKNGVSGLYDIFEATESTEPTRMTGTNVHFDNSMTTRHWNFSGGGMLSTLTAVDSVKISGETEIVSGEVSVYGITK